MPPVEGTTVVWIVGLETIEYRKLVRGQQRADLIVRILLERVDVRTRSGKDGIGLCLLIIGEVQGSGTALVIRIPGAPARVGRRETRKGIGVARD
jgi:hypothetical protein